MDTVINRLSDIEEAAGAIVEEANVRKKAYAAEIEKKTADFDQDSKEDGDGYGPALSRTEGSISGSVTGAGG